MRKPDWLVQIEAAKEAEDDPVIEALAHIGNHVLDETGLLDRRITKLDERITKLDRQNGNRVSEISATKGTEHYRAREAAHHAQQLLALVDSGLCNWTPHLISRMDKLTAWWERTRTERGTE